MAKKPALPERDIFSKNGLGLSATPKDKLASETKGNPLFASRGGKIFLGVIAFMVVFTLGYGTWRLSGGSFKPKTSCPDATVETRLRDQATANATNYALQMEYGNYLYSQCKKFSPASETFQKAVSLAVQPTEKVQAHLNLGLTYFYQQQLKEAQSEFRTVSSLEPQNTLGLYMLASTLRQEDPKQAAVLFQKVVELSPDSAVGKEAQKSAAELAKP